MWLKLSGSGERWEAETKEGWWPSVMESGVRQKSCWADLLESHLKPHPRACCQNQFLGPQLVSVCQCSKHVSCLTRSNISYFVVFVFFKINKRKHLCSSPFNSILLASSPQANFYYSLFLTHFSHIFFSYI